MGFGLVSSRVAKKELVYVYELETQKMGLQTKMKICGNKRFRKMHIKPNSDAVT